MLKRIFYLLLKLLYRVEVKGLENFSAAGDKVLIVANHVSFLDALLLGVFLPEKLTFAINTRVAKAWWVRPFASLVRVFPMDPANPLAMKALIKHLNANNKVVIFPEGRISVTGALMKIYQGPGLIADKAKAAVLPVRIDGAQFSPFSRSTKRLRLHLFPRITLTLMPATTLQLPAHLHGKARRSRAGQQLADIMTELIFATSNHNRTLFSALLEARARHGGSQVIAEDIQRNPVTYNQFLTKIFVLGKLLLADGHRRQDNVGLLLPNAVSTAVTFFALHLHGRVPAMLNYTLGQQGAIAAVETANIRIVYTSRRFIEAAQLQELVAAVANYARVIYLEDMVQRLSLLDKITGVIAARFFARSMLSRYGGNMRPQDPAVVLFTSGSESTPKGVVLSHSNLLANIAQISAPIDFGSRDVLLNALPLFHSFGLTAGTLLPLLSGVRVFLYPSPLHYRLIPEICYEINATLLFGTSTFLAGYGRHAHPYDFYSLRYVFAGAEKLKEETRRLWAEKFGVRIFEGYGTTEASPVLASNTPMNCRAGTVGRLLPGIAHYLEPVEGLQEGGRLVVSGPNIMLGYLLHKGNGEILPPRTERGAGWYDTGDVVSLDQDGYVRICGRAKRFAKIGGEMVSLAAVEELAYRVWPDVLHAAIALADERKGEQIILLTEQKTAARNQLQEQLHSQGLSELMLPKKVFVVKAMPLLGSGKIDYGAAKALMEKLLTAV